MYCKILVIARCAELDVVPVLANATELVGDLLFVELDAVDDLPSVDDVDSVVALVAQTIEAVDSEAQGAAEEVAHYLGHSRPSVGVGARGSVPLKLAVLQKWFDRVAASVPVKVKRQVLFRRGDDGAVSHLDDLPFGACARRS